MKNGMVYIRDFGLILHEIKGRLLAYQITKSLNDVTEYKALESWY